MKSLFTRDYLECSFDEGPMVLFHVWLRKPTSAELKEGLTSVHAEFMKYKNEHGKLLNWLGDTRKLGVLSVDDQGWLDKVWNEMLFVKAGVKVHAVIIGADVFSKYAMDKFKNSMLAKHGEGLHMDTFVDKEAAYKWFESIDK